MTFFYDLNKKLDSIREKPEVTHKQLNERDEGKPGKNFAKIAKDAGDRYGSKAAGERVAGAVRNKLRDQGKLEEEGMSRAAKGYEKYGREGMEALAKAGREGKSLDPVRKKYDKYDESQQVDEISDELANRAAQGRRDQFDAAKKKSQAAINAERNTVGGSEDEKWARWDNSLALNNATNQAGVKMGQNMQLQKSRLARQANAAVAEGGSYLNYADSHDENVRAGKKPAAPTAPKPQGVMDKMKSVGKKVAGGINKLVGHGSDEEMRKDVQRKAGAAVTGKMPQQVKEKMSPAKQKSFAALAPPTDKITFADKIAGAKKEVDEMLGQVAAEAMRNAVGGGQGRNAAMDEERSKGTAFDMSTPRATKPKVGSIERGHKHDIKHTATGRMVTRRVDDQGNSVGADDDSDTQAGPRGRGRPKGTKGAIGAKGPSGRSKLMTKEGANQGQAQQIVDDLAELRAMAKQAQRGGEFPQGFASQLEVALYAAMTLIKNQQSGDAQVREESTTKKDDRAEKAGKKVTKDIEYDEGHKGKDDNKAEKAGKKVTKDIEYDEKKKDKEEEEVDESTTSGSIATSTTTKGSKGGVYGKGIYDSMNFELEQMIAESMSINMSDSTEGNKSLTVTATDDDALKLGMMLKNSGLGGGDSHSGDMHSHEESCPTCGMEDCGCGDVQEAVDENAPDWPTNTETSDNAMQYSGGLNKPKASGMATVPVTDVSVDGEDMFGKQANEDALRRMMEMAGIKQAELEPWKETMKETADDVCNDCHKDPCECDESVEESIQRMREIAGIKEAKKPDFLDMDKDGDKKEPMTKAIKDKEEKKVDESIFALTNQWKAYRG